MTLGLQEPLDPMEREVLLAVEVFLVRMGYLVKRVPKVSEDWVGHLVPKVPMVTLDALESQVFQGHGVCQVFSAPRVLRDTKDQWEEEERMGDQVQQGQMVPEV